MCLQAGKAHVALVVSVGAICMQSTAAKHLHAHTCTWACMHIDTRACTCVGARVHARVHVHTRVGAPPQTLCHPFMRRTNLLCTGRSRNLAKPGPKASAATTIYLL